VVAETRALTPATPDGLIGTWEALVQDDSIATAVYQMVIPKQGDAHLIQLYAGDSRPWSKFFGSSSSIKVENGKVTIRFIMALEHVQYCDWVEIQGYAVAEGTVGAITGKIIRHRKDGPREEWSEPVAFKKGLWIRDLQKVSEQASLILNDPKLVEGHAVAVSTARAMATARSSRWSDARVEETKRRGDAICKAVDSYRARLGKLPQDLRQLQPEFLREIPQPTAGDETWHYKLSDSGRNYWLQVEDPEPAFAPMLQRFPDGKWEFSK